MGDPRLTCLFKGETETLFNKTSLEVDYNIKSVELCDALRVAYDGARSHSGDVLRLLRTLRCCRCLFCSLLARCDLARCLGANPGAATEQYRRGRVSEEVE